jgi:hypothetical protein
MYVTSNMEMANSDSPNTYWRTDMISPMEEIMDTIHFTSKGRLMDTLEKFYIFCKTKLGNQINNKLTLRPNIVFETTVQKDPHRGIPSACSMQ